MIYDLHSHMVFPCYLEGLEKQGVDPLKEDGFPTPSWSPEEHLAMMDACGIDRALLSLSSPHIWHGDAAAAAELARQINEETAAVCRKWSDRFAFAACLPAPDVDACLAEIRYACDTLGASAVKLPSSSGGIYPGDPRMDPIFAELNARGAIVLLHPCRPDAVPEHVFTAGPVPLFEFIADTTRTVINLITSGTIERYPDLKIIVPHSGSFLPFVAHRLAGISKILIPQGLMEETNVLEACKKLYYDVAGDVLPAALPALLQIADPSHIVYGGDYPYTPAPMVREKLALLKQAKLPEGLLDAILSDNAERLIGSRWNSGLK